MSTPEISIVLASWNSAAYLPQCLAALQQQSYREFEIILVDNGSTDGTCEGLEMRTSNTPLRIERLPQNRGFAAANNLGIRLARGRWVALLNTDAFPETDWLEQLMLAAAGNPEYSCFASLQIQSMAPHLLDGAGDAYHVGGHAWRRYYNCPVGQFGLVQEEVFSACAAAALYRRQTVLEVGGFDEDFFSYYEDVDLGFRLRLRGHGCLFVPQARVRHVGSPSVGLNSAFMDYHLNRNFTWSFFKNTPRSLFAEAVPAHWIATLRDLRKSVRRGHGRVFLRAKLDALRALPRLMEKRSQIQKGKTVRDAELLTVMERGWLPRY